MFGVVLPLPPIGRARLRACLIEIVIIITLLSTRRGSKVKLARHRVMISARHLLMDLQIVYYTLPLVFIMVLVFVIAARLRVSRIRVIRISILVESTEHSLHVRLVHCLEPLGL